MPPVNGLEMANGRDIMDPLISGRPAGRTVGDAMLTDVKLSPASVTVADLRRLFADSHVHVALIVVNARLLSVIARTDITGSCSGPALGLGRRQSRVVAPGADLEQTRCAMRSSGRRRLAVTTADGTLLGLLCLKRDGTGFCSDRDVHARASARRESGSTTDDSLEVLF